MRVTTSTDAAAFATLAAPAIEAEPILHSVLASVLLDAPPGTTSGAEAIGNVLQEQAN